MNLLVHVDILPVSFFGWKEEKIIYERTKYNHNTNNILTLLFFPFTKDICFWHYFWVLKNDFCNFLCKFLYVNLYDIFKYTHFIIISLQWCIFKINKWTKIIIFGVVIL